MNIHSTAADSITPSTQQAGACKQRVPASVSFGDTLRRCMETENVPVNYSAETGGIKERAENLVSELETMQTVMGDLQSFLGDFFSKNGLPKDPPVTLGYDKESGEVTVSGEREDADRIRSLINSDDQLKSGVIHALDKAEILVALTNNLNPEKNNQTDSADVSVNLVFGSRAAFDSSESIRQSQLLGSKEYSEDSELAELFDTISHMLLMLFINKDPDEEETEEARDTNGAADEVSADENSGAEEYKRLLMEVERSRQRAMFLFGTSSDRHTLFADEMMEEDERTSEDKSEKTAETEDSGVQV